MLDTTFIDELASAAPTPGGGGASAYCGALASALVSMVGELTVGKKRSVDQNPQVKEALVELVRFRTRLLNLIDEDAVGFAPLAASYRLPQDTPEQKQAKHAAQQAALAGACQPPLDIMRCCAKVIEHCDLLAHIGSRLALSDAGVAAVFAKAALQGASLNLFINVQSMDDSAVAADLRREAESLIGEFAPRADAVYEYVFKEIS